MSRTAWRGAAAVSAAALALAAAALLRTGDTGGRQGPPERHRFEEAHAPLAPPSPATTVPAPPAAEPGVASPDGLAAVVRAKLADPRFGSATVGVSVWVDGVGEVVAHNADTPLKPASTQKILTAMGALSVLGPDATLSTVVRSAVTQEGPTLTGDLVLVGGGDPSLRSVGPHSFDALAAQLRGRGVQEIAGDLVGDESRFDTKRSAPGWFDWHVPSFVGPLSALAVDGNQVRADPDYVSNPVPANLAAFRGALRRHGIRVAGGEREGSAPPDSQVLASLQSAPVAALVQDMLSRSDNFTAELLLKETGYRARGRGTTADGATAAAAAVARLGVELDGRAADGSGLSREDRSTAREWRDLLLAVRNQPWADVFVQGLPLAGRTGTLASRFGGTAAEGFVRAKTGAIREGRSLSGYLTTATGRHAVFSVLVNGEPLPPGVTAAMDDLVAAMVADGS